MKIRNEELWKRGEQQSVGKQILRRKWRWIGLTLQKAPSNITRQSVTWNLMGRETEKGRSPQN